MTNNNEFKEFVAEKKLSDLEWRFTSNNIDLL